MIWNFGRISKELFHWWQILKNSKKFATWLRTNLKKEDTLKILFSDEKIFGIDGVCNAQSNRVWAVDRDEADEKGRRKQKRKYSQKVMIWLGACWKGVRPLVILGKGTIDHDRYIREVLPVAIKYGNKVFGDDWTYQQDNATPHTHNLTEEWWGQIFPSFIDKDHWPPLSSDLNPLDYSIWEQFVQQMNWNKVQSKKMSIEELKQAIKWIRQEVIFESCDTWTNRLCRLTKDTFEYFWIK